MGKVVWFTGLSGSGKTTIAIKLKEIIEKAKKTVYIIDGDVIRSTVHSHLGFTKDDINRNNQLIAELALSVLKEYDFILVPIISPYEENRIMAKKLIGNDNFIELYISTPLDVCIRRDPKGLYKKALNGEIENFIGISNNSPYQPPLKPDIEINASGADAGNNIGTIIDFILARKTIKS